MPELSRADWVREATRTLHEAAVDSPRLSAELILQHVCGISRVELATRPETFLTSDQLSRMAGLLRRRADGEPAAYLLGQREFYGRDFRVTPATLIPRPETEHLIEAALKGCDGPASFADLGTGSGCIAVTLCAERPDWRGLMVDLSAARWPWPAKTPCATMSASGSTRRADFTRPLLRPESLDRWSATCPMSAKPNMKGSPPKSVISNLSRRSSRTLWTRTRSPAMTTIMTTAAATAMPLPLPRISQKGWNT
ncbi:MAG: N5-glutamine methyltransferase family protein [Bilophila wadsworthia]